jgi:hypothetical protein
MSVMVMLLMTYSLKGGKIFTGMVFTPYFKYVSFGLLTPATGT